MGIDKEPDINNRHETVNEFDKLPKSDKQDDWLQFNMNLMKVKDFRILNSVINLCFFELDNVNISRARREWIQRVNGSCDVKIAGYAEKFEGSFI